MQSLRKLPRSSAEFSPARTIPSLDGLRAVSIALVVFSHVLYLDVLSPALSGAINHRLAPGPLGVRVFFIISGFLITTLLLTEQERSGRLRLGRFYFRRTLRIFPPFYVFLSAMWGLARAGVVTIPRGDFFHAFTYTTSLTHSSWYLGHAWSLAIEEQFYLLWPGVMVAAGALRSWKVAVGVVLLGPAIKVVLFALTPVDRYGEIGSSFLGVVDCLAVGCTLAALRPRLHESVRYRRLLRSPLLWLIAPASVLCWCALGHWHVGVVSETFGLCGFAFCVDRLVTFPGGRIGRALNAAPVAWVGRLSYSLYLWQQLFTAHERNDAALAATGLTSFPVNIAAALVCAVISYYVVERPSLRLRTWLEAGWDARRRVRSPASALAA